ncbi:MAG TPA: OmpA family protein, partial [Sorangium sp.]|nr:OmpA family protein [Sorangium sp.]
VFAPTGPSDSYVAEGAVYGQPQLLLGGRADNFVWSASGGVVLRASANPHTVTFKGALGLELLDGALMLGPEVYGSAALEQTPFVDNGAVVIARTTGVNLEGLFGAQGYVADGFTFGAAAGMGLTSGVGSPRFRLLGRIAWAPRPARVVEVGDRDGDTIKDDVDACPDTKGFANEDPLKHGCPHPSDMDGDDILDEVDACPKTPGVANDDPAENGCPAPADRDGDKILDAADACPDQPGVASDDPAKHGCPPPGDRDADGIVDEDDACPDVPGIASDDPEKNGCPPDSDGDGIIDAKDACPDTAGVASKDPNRHGCPPDRDGDGVLDNKDACPDTPGARQKDPKRNGCPRAIVTDKEIIILQRVEFATGRATIKRISDPLLDDVASLMRKHTDIELIEVQGHTDNRGGKRLNQRLSEARAKAVRKALIGRGIDGSRLTFRGYGMDLPRASNATAAGRQENRRVQFKIVRRRKKH